MRILVVEDGDGVTEALLSPQAPRVYEVARARTAAEALAARRHGPPADLVLLDLRVAGHDGAELGAALRAEHDAPLIVVTDRGEAEAGAEIARHAADDWVLRPFSTAELLARTEVVLRRARGPEPEPPIEVGQLRIELGARTVAAGAEAVVLTDEEFDLLAALARAEGAPVERRRLLAEAWGAEGPRRSGTLDVHVAALRSKLGPWATIEIVRGVGYCLTRARRPVSRGDRPRSGPDPARRRADA